MKWLALYCKQVKYFCKQAKFLCRQVKFWLVYTSKEHTTQVFSCIDKPNTNKPVITCFCRDATREIWCSQVTFLKWLVYTQKMTCVRVIFEKWLVYTQKILLLCANHFFLKMICLHTKKVIFGDCKQVKFRRRATPTSFMCRQVKFLTCLRSFFLV